MKTLKTITKRTVPLMVGMLSLALLSASTPSPTLSHVDAEHVYICTGPQSKRYHKTQHCQGLGRCSKEVKRVTKAYAVSQGRTPCGWCYSKKKKAT